MDTVALADLRARHRGPVIAPEDDAYHEARVTFNALTERRPALIARPLDHADIVSAVAFAAEAGLPVSIRGGGHSVAGHCIGDDSLVVDLRLMRDVVVDPVERTASCGGGALWEDFDPPCQRHGLATPGGTFGDTGVAGLTLGGGIGHLIGSFGLTLDNLLAATVVTADGQVVTAAEDENEDLFWALRGGGGNFGVVADFTFRLHPVGRMLGGVLWYGLEHAPAVLRAFRDLMAEAPDGLTCMAQVFRSPRLDVEGAWVSVAYLGEAEEGQRLIAPLRRVAAPVSDTVRPMYYVELQELFGRLAFGLRNYWSGRFVRDLTDDVIDLTVGQVLDGDARGDVLIEPLHGAARRVPPQATAFPGREARYNSTFLGIWTEPGEDSEHVERARAYSTALAPWQLAGGYINYSTDPAEGAEAAFGTERFERLRAVKRTYDPANTFRFNHNIPPD
jgi:FAD/FMN-containing dehydrogenase